MLAPISARTDGSGYTCQLPGWIAQVSCPSSRRRVPVDARNILRHLPVRCGSAIDIHGVPINRSAALTSALESLFAAAHLAGLTLLAFIGHSVAALTTDDYLLDRDPRRRTSTRTTHFVSVPSSTATCRALEGS